MTEPAHSRAHAPEGFALAEPTEAAAPRWLRDLGHAELAQICHAMRAQGFDSQADELASPSALRSRSRQARHAQLQRMRSTAAACTLLRAIHDADMRRILALPAFALLRPYSLDVLTKMSAIARGGISAPEAGVTALFDAAARQLCEALARLGREDGLEDLVAMTAIAALTVCGVLHGRRLHARWREVEDELADAGALANRAVSVRIASLCSWYGREQEHVAVLLDTSYLRTRQRDAFLFARNDAREELFELAVLHLRGEDFDPGTLLLPGRPGSTLRHGLDGVMSLFRDGMHLRTPAQALMLLTSLDDTLAYIRGRGPLGSSLTPAVDLLLRVRSFERVQQMDKRRFWALYDQLEAGPCKDRLIELWSVDYAEALARAIADACGRTH